MTTILDNILLGRQQLNPQVDYSGFGQEYLDNPVMTSQTSPITATQPTANPMLQVLEMFKTIKNNPEYASIFGGNNEQKINEALAERDKIGKFDMKNWLTATLPSLGILMLGSLMTRGRGGDPGLAMSNIQQGYQQGATNKAAKDLDMWTKKWQSLQEDAKSGDAFKKLILSNAFTDAMNEKKMKTVDPTHDVYVGEKKVSSGTPKEKEIKGINPEYDLYDSSGKLIQKGTSKQKITDRITTLPNGKKVWVYDDGTPSNTEATSIPKEFAEKWGERLMQDKKGKYGWYAFDKTSNETGQFLRNATEKDLKTGNKTTVSFASHSKWDSTIDKELKELTSRYKLTGSEVLNVDPNNPQALLALFMSKGLTAESARDFKVEYDRIKEIQALGRDDIEEGISPYKRLGKKAQSAVKDSQSVIGDVLKGLKQTATRPTAQEIESEIDKKFTQKDFSSTWRKKY